MSAPARERSRHEDSDLHAYHDGELRGLARWRLQRRLRRSPALRAELDALAAIGTLAREADAEVTAPDLWHAIARGLPAADAVRREARSPERAGGWPALWPVGAAAAAAAVVAAVVFLLPASRPAPGGVVRWVDGGGHTGAVLESDPDTTIIWVLEGASDAAREGDGRAFI